MRIKRELVLRYLEDYCNTLSKEDLVNFKVRKSCVLYNYIVKENLTSDDVDSFARILFQDKNETLDQMIARI